MKKITYLVLGVLLLLSCNSNQSRTKNNDFLSLSNDVKNETIRAWEAYTKYAWGHDELKPLSKSKNDWYKEPLFISLIDAYSTLKIMGFNQQAKRIECFVADSLSFDKDIYVKTFEVNIRILGGLLSMYDLTGNNKILIKAEDFANRILKSFNSQSGLPYYYVNLKTGKTKGDTICAAEAASYTLEMGVLSYYTKKPMYYQMAKKCTQIVYANKSKLGLIKQDYSVKTGKAVSNNSRTGAAIDSYYEYLYKTWILFGDNDLKLMWDSLKTPINKYIASETDTSLWYGIVNSENGSLVSSSVTLWDAYFPAMLIYSGDTLHAKKSMISWTKLWNKNDLLPMEYNFETQKIMNPKYYLNPELIESTYYMWYLTKDSTYYKMEEKFYNDVKKYCRNNVAYSDVEDVLSKKQVDQLSTFFFAETLKYFWLTFSQSDEYNLKNYVFSTEAHPFKKSHFEKDKIKQRLGL